EAIRNAPHVPAMVRYLVFSPISDLPSKSTASSLRHDWDVYAFFTIRYSGKECVMTMDFKIATGRRAFAPTGGESPRRISARGLGPLPGRKDNRILGRGSQASGHDRGGQPRTGAGLLRLSGLQEPCAARRGDKIPTDVRALAAKDLETMRHSRETASPRPNFA